MDEFVTGASCSNAKNFALAPSSLVSTYHAWAQNYALADRYFQPIASAGPANGMFLASANYAFADNAFEPDAIGKGCAPAGPTPKEYQGLQTIADLLVSAKQWLRRYFGMAQGGLRSIRAAVSLNFSTDPFFGACLALLASSCITPPGAAGGGGRDPNTASAEQRPIEFSHTSAELLKKMGLGWNLGNSLDVPEGETAWGNPRVTPELMSAVAKAGFGLVRIPITWAKHTGPAPDYAIEPSWFQRVDQVVGYARSAGLHVIINLHHDGADGFKGVQWLALKDATGNTTEANNAAVKAHFVAVWTQIAKHFAGSGEELLFESMNEVHDGYGTPDPRHFAFINDLNQEFVNLVRASGGNNAKRHLIVPGYNTNIDHTITGFKLPIDSVDKRLILSVHFYDPYLFALEAKTHTWGSASPGRDDFGQEDSVVKQFDRLKSTFIDQGVPVLIGEYGAAYQAGFEDYRRYYMEYVTKAAIDRGMLPVYWDNGGTGSGGEKFALVDRHTNSILHPELIEALRRAATSPYSLSNIALPTPSK